MLFVLTNVLASFEHFINNVQFLFLEWFITTYIDDILIYSDSLEKHQGHVQSLLEELSKAGLHLKSKKCEFHHQ